MQFPELHTERLTLRMITQEVLDYAFAHFPDWQIMEFLGLPSEEILVAEKEKHRKGLSTYNRTFLYFKLVDNSTNKVIGWCGYHTWHPHHNRAELGYGLDADSYKQQGIMSEALAAILQYGFNQMNLHRVEAMTATDNIASIKTLAKFGFVQEGILREHYFVDGVMEDSLMFSLLKGEFSL